MWSGPRNISTAMMRSFGSRPDTAVTDEPLYAHYLKVTGVAHPGRDDVLAAHESDWRKSPVELTGPVPGGRAIWYQKHMAHHLLPMIERGWLDGLHARFPDPRDPDEMLASLVKTFPRRRARRHRPAAADARSSIVSPGRIVARAAVVLASDVLKDPRAQLELSARRSAFHFCRRCSPGPRDLATRTAPGPRIGTRPSRHRPVPSPTGNAAGRSHRRAASGSLDECRPWYEKLYALRLRA